MLQRYVSFFIWPNIKIKKVPRRLDAAPVNTKTMCLITKLLYKTNLKSLIVFGRLLISRILLTLRIHQNLVLWDRHEHLVHIEVEATSRTPFFDDSRTILRQ